MTRRFCQVLIGLVVTGIASSALAAGATTFVLSDHVKFIGVATPGAAQGTYDFHSTKCHLSSDGEDVTYKCSLTGSVASTATGFSGNATVESADGVTQFTFTLTPTSTPGEYALKGSGTEKDAPDPGEGPPPAYDCRVRGKITATPQADGTIALQGGFRVLEASTAP